MTHTGVVCVVVCDDYPLACAGACSAITAEAGLQVAAVATEGSAAAEVVRRLRPDIALLAYRLPGPPLTELVAEIAGESSVRTLVYGAEQNAPLAETLLACGACGHLLREDTAESLIRAIHAALSGGCWVSPGLRRGAGAASLPESAPRGRALTPRQREVLALLAAGRSNAEIAAALCLAPQTVRNYVSAIYDRLDVRSRAEAIVWGRERRYHEAHSVSGAQVGWSGGMGVGDGSAPSAD